jgi:tetratricopeptide (TPR) repeat protein
VCESLGKTDSARAAFQRALDVRPDLPNLALNFGTLELRHKSYQRALKLYGKGLEAYPGDPDLYYGAALAHYGLRQKDSAAALVSVLKRDFPDYGKLDQLQELIR